MTSRPVPGHKYGELRFGPTSYEALWFTYCQCGEWQPPVYGRSREARADWHRDHKDRILAGGAS